MPRKSRRDATTRAVLDAYDQELPLHSAFTTALKDLIVQLLIANQIGFHSVTCRTKARSSLERKLAKPSAQYLNLRDVTDVCAVRITTYFEDTVDTVASLIEQEFEVDRTNSIDKRALLDPDRFGYLSLHHVVSLSDARARLAEYRRYTGYKAEIQTRSILQHAWAEIEHDLGYKSNLAVPAEVRRRFARLAGMLELADKEFTGIRKELDAYQAAVPARIDEQPEGVGIDKTSLDAFVHSDSIARQLDTAIISLVGAQLKDDNPDFLEDDPQALLSLGITTIDELDRLMREKAATVLEFTREWLKGDTHEAFNAGISLFYFWYVMMGSTGNRDAVVAGLEARNVGPDEEGIGIAEDVLSTYRRVAAKLSRSTDK